MPKGGVGALILYLYVLAPSGDDVDQVVTDWRTARNGFVDSGLLPASDDLETPKPAADWDGPMLAYRFNFGRVGSAPVSRTWSWSTTRAFHAVSLSRMPTVRLALDNRALYTKLDWLFWTPILADNRADFDALISPAYKFANETPDRLPLTDFYEMDKGDHSSLSGALSGRRNFHQDADGRADVEEVGRAPAPGAR